MSKYKTNDRVVITDCKHGHEYKIGETVTLGKYSESSDDFEAENFNGESWYVRDDEFKLASH